MLFYCIDSALEHINLGIMRFTNVVYNNNDIICVPLTKITFYKRELVYYKKNCRVFQFR